jgi:hypothetical protein
MRLLGDPGVDQGQTLPPQKVEFFTLKYTLNRYGTKGHKHTYVDTKGFLKGWKSGLLVNFCQFPCAFPKRIRIQESQINADSCGSGSTVQLFASESESFCFS